MAAKTFSIQALPNFFDMQYCNETGGRLAPDGLLYNDQTFQALNALMTMFNDMASTLLVNIPSLQAVGIPPSGPPLESPPVLLGINPPSFTTAQISAIVALTAPNPVVPAGTLWFNSTLNKLQFYGSDNAVHTITST